MSRDLLYSEKYDENYENILKNILKRSTSIFLEKVPFLRIY